jgi:hypothetical protein
VSRHRAGVIGIRRRRRHRVLFPPLRRRPPRVAEYDRNAASAWDSAFAPASAKVGVGTVMGLRAAFCNVEDVKTRGNPPPLIRESRARDA